MSARLWLSAVWLGLAAQAVGQDVPPVDAAVPLEEYARRRTALYAFLGADGVALLQGAPSPVGYTRFRQSNDFHYLSGVEVPHAYLLLDGRSRRATLFLPHRNPRREHSEGRLLAAEDSEEALRLTGLEAVAPLEALGEQLGRLAQGGRRTLHVPYQPAEGLAVSRDVALRTQADLAADPWDGRPSREGVLLRHLRERFPMLELRDLSPWLDGARLIKTPAEIALIKRATRLACLGLQEAMRSTAPGVYEHELEAVAKFAFVRHGAWGESYYALVASGPNAWYPHYHAGRRRLQDGELVLVDFAPDLAGYQSDVTRQWPVNGRFSPEQRELYGFYLRVYRALLEAIRPGRTAVEVRRAAAVEWDRALAETRFSKALYERAARTFVEDEKKATLLGHWLGRAAHDVGSFEGPLQPGMVLTIEPQFRVPEERLYWRLEDVLVITAAGVEVLSEDLPWRLEDVERTLAEEGWLQRVPRDPALGIGVAGSLH